MDIQVNAERMKKEFAELTGIDSVSFDERRMADRMKEKLEETGFTVSEDDYEGSSAGNLSGFLKGDLPGDPVLLSAHLDTVQPGCAKHAIFHEDGMITSAGDTVLGADDVAGLTEILEGIRCVQEAGIPHRDIEIIFPVAEEMHAKGSAAFDYSNIKSREAYVFDLSGPIGTAAVEAPSIVTFNVTVTGKAAHAGFAPQDGINAVAVMSEAISHIRQGRYFEGTDEETTLNIGSVCGGGATNIVPDKCVCRGEIRSCSHEQVMKMADIVKREFEDTASRANAGCSVELTVNMTAYKIEEDAPVVRHFLKACENLSLSGLLMRTYGGSDYNNFALHGISGLVLSCGMQEVHSVREFIRMEDLLMGARLVAELICS